MGGPGLAASDQVPSPPPKGENALRRRVSEFYSFLQAGNWSQAEKYIAKDSLEVFRNQQKTPFFGFQIDSIKLSPDGQSASVVVRVRVMTAYAPTPIPFPRPSNWRLIRGVWQAEASEAKGSMLLPEFQLPSTPKGAPHRLPPPAELKFESLETIVDPIHPGEVREVRFPFKNLTNHVVRLGNVSTGSDSLRFMGEKKEYNPGEAGTLVFEWDPVHSNYSYGLEDTIVLTTEPGGAVISLTARTYVYALIEEDSNSQSKK